MKIVFGIILLLGALLAVTAKPFAEPCDEPSVEILAAAERDNEDKILEIMMNHIMASMMQSNDDGSDIMKENVSGEQHVKLQKWKNIMKDIRKYGPYVLKILGKK